MKAIIEDSYTGEKYEVNKIEDCRDEVDRSAYEAYQWVGLTIQMGSIVVYSPKYAN